MNKASQWYLSYCYVLRVKHCIFLYLEKAFELKGRLNFVLETFFHTY